jgi:arylsulfatase A-like enzyme
VPPFASEWPDFYRGLVEYDARQLTRFADLYDEELRRVDTIVGRIVGKVRSQGRIDETVLVVTSDHGENLGDHGHIDHVFSLYDSTVKIPLLIRYPPRFLAGTRSPALVQLPDLFPTILAAVGVPEEEIGGQGVDLAQEEQLEGRPQIIEYYRPLQALGRLYERSTPEQRLRLDRYDRKLEAIVTGRYKLVRGSDGETELFDHEADPEELFDLALRPQAASERHALEDELDEWLDRYVDEGREAGEHLDLPEETRRALEAIGYLE